MSASETESGVDEWTVVQGRSEPSKTFRVLQRATVRTEAQATSTESPQQPDDVEPEKKSTLTRDLVGAPIRRRFYSPRQDRETGPGSSHSNHSGLNEKIGGILRLPRVSSTHPSSSSNAHINSLSPIDQDNDDLDLTDYGEWPSMSTVEPNSMAPRTPLWPILVESPKIQHGEEEEPVVVTTPPSLPIESEEKDKSGKKKKKTAKREPLTLDLDAIFQSLELKESKKIVVATGGGSVALSKQHKMVGTTQRIGERIGQGGNMLDSSAPTKRRGKEREIPKAKKPSALRKVIIREKEERKKEVEGVVDEEERGGVQLDEECTERDEKRQTEKVFVPVTPKPPSIHNRKFREYCNHLVTEDINEEVTLLLTQLMYFQDRQFMKDPIKARAKKRYVCGLKEVLKHLKLKKIKCVIVPPNLDRIESEGGVIDYVQQILHCCQEQAVPTVFAASRRRLAVILKKKHKIGCVGIFFYDGAETHYKRLMGLVEAAREEYNSHLTSLQTSGSAVVISPTSTSSHSTSPTLSPQHFSSTESIDKEKGTPPQPQLLSLNVHANEFVPSITHSFNINATVFTPMLHFSSS